MDMKNKEFIIKVTKDSHSERKKITYFGNKSLEVPNEQLQFI